MGPLAHAIDLPSQSWRSQRSIQSNRLLARCSLLVKKPYFHFMIFQRLKNPNPLLLKTQHHRSISRCLRLNQPQPLTRLNRVIFLYSPISTIKHGKQLWPSFWRLWTGTISSRVKNLNHLKLTSTSTNGKSELPKPRQRTKFHALMLYSFFTKALDLPGRCGLRC